MAGERRGRIRAADIATVRERSKIDEIVGEHLQLKRAGGGSLKGLCPFHDEKSPSFQVTPTRNLFHCVAGETGVLTENGTVPIRELAGRTVRVLNGDGGWVEAPFRSYGVQRLMKVTVTRNGRTKSLFATDRHRWFVPTGALRQHRREKLTEELRPGDRLSHSFPMSRVLNPATRPSPFGIARGLVYGDGTRAGAGSIAVLYGEKDAELARYFGGAVRGARSGGPATTDSRPTSRTNGPHWTRTPPTCSAGWRGTSPRTAAWPTTVTRSSTPRVRRTSSTYGRCARGWVSARSGWPSRPGVASMAR